MPCPFFFPTNLVSHSMYSSTSEHQQSLLAHDHYSDNANNKNYQLSTTDARLKSALHQHHDLCNIDDLLLIAAVRSRAYSVSGDDSGIDSTASSARQTIALPNQSSTDTVVTNSFDRWIANAVLPSEKSITNADKLWKQSHHRDMYMHTNFDVNTDSSDNANMNIDDSLNNSYTRLLMERYGLLENGCDGCEGRESRVDTESSASELSDMHTTPQSISQSTSQSITLSTVSDRVSVSEGRRLSIPKSQLLLPNQSSKFRYFTNLSSLIFYNFISKLSIFTFIFDVVMCFSFIIEHAVMHESTYWYTTLFLLLLLSFIVLMINALRSESRWEVIASITLRCLLAITVLIDTIFNQPSDIYVGLRIFELIFSGCAITVYILLANCLLPLFDYKTYRLMNADSTFVIVYEIYQLFLTLLKFDAVCTVQVAICLVPYMIDISLTMAILTTILVGCFSIARVICGYVSMKHQQLQVFRGFMYLLFIETLGGITLIIVGVIFYWSLPINGGELSCLSFFFLSICVIVRCLLIVCSLFMRRNLLNAIIDRLVNLGSNAT